MEPIARFGFSFDDMTPPAPGATQSEFDAALQNYYSFIKKFGVRDGCVARQLHGAEIVQGKNINRTRPFFPLLSGEGDAIWTDEKNLWVGVFTADCLPALVDAGERVMAIHAGWRGLAAGILEKCVGFLGADKIQKVVLGPAACGCCYEVGPEVVAAIKDPVMQGRNLDLPLTAERRFRALGVERIERSVPFGCTICDMRFPSYRRSKPNAGRSLAAIAI